MERLEACFSNVLDTRGEQTREAQYNVTPGWDSIAHMQLIAEIEDCFEIMLDTDDVVNLSSFGKACEIVRKYGVTLDDQP